MESQRWFAKELFLARTQGDAWRQWTELAGRRKFCKWIALNSLDKQRMLHTILPPLKWCCWFNPKYFAAMICRDLRFWVCGLHLCLVMKIKSHAIIRDNIDFNRNFFTGMESLFNLDHRHFILSQGKLKKIASHNLYFFTMIFCKANKVLRYWLFCFVLFCKWLLNVLVSQLKPLKCLGLPKKILVSPSCI